MEPQLLFLLAFVLFAGLAGCAILIFGAFIAIFIKRLSNFNKMLTAEFSAPPAEDFLNTASLCPWETSAFADLSCRWVGAWYHLTRLGRYEGYTRGIVQSLHEPKGPGWFAFTVDSDFRQSRQSIIRIKTSAQQVELRVNGQRLDPNVHVQARVDGNDWGSIAVTHPACLYQSADRSTAARWTPIFRAKRIFFFTKLVVSNPDYYPLVVNNRPIASLADLWISNPQPRTPNPFPAAIQGVRDDLKPYEQNILLIMLGMSLYFDSLHTRRQGYDW